MAIPLPREAAAMDEINMTPLIDVMLVLLVMFIITIPIQTHAIRVDLPQDCPRCEINPYKNKIVITDGGAILWNGTPVTEPELASTLSISARMKPEPELHLQPEANARYEIVDEVLAMTKRANVRRLGFVGNESYKTF